MQICITKKLAEKMKLSKLPSLEQLDGFYIWRANLTQSGRHRLLVFMNDASRYVLVVKQPTVVTFKRLTEIFTDIFRQALLMEQINIDVINRYIAEMGEVKFVANSGRTETTWLNKACDNAWYGMNSYSDNANLSVFASHLNVGAYDIDSRTKPSTVFAELLARYELPVKKSTVFDLIVRLDLNGNDAVRKIRVPSNITFMQLHKIIQKAYNWNNYHLFRFCFYKNEKFEYYAEAEVELVCSEETVEMTPNAIHMHDIRISDYFPKWKKCIYNYDYGDDWYHHIELSDIIENYSDDLPKLLIGAGDAPPEDVGGIGGFADFLDIISNPNNDEYENMIEWSKMQRWKQFDFDGVSRKVKHALWW